jgi:hypothetical protein
MYYNIDLVVVNTILTQLTTMFVSFLQYTAISYMEYEILTFAGYLVLLPVINLALIFICVYTPVDFLSEVVFARYISLNLDRSVFFL